MPVIEAAPPRSRSPRPLGQRRGLLLLAGAGVALEVGWLILWLLGYRLTHGAEFTDTYLASRPVIRAVLEGLLGLASRVGANLEAPGTPYVLSDTLLVGCALLGAAYLGALILLDRGAAGARGAAWLVLGFALLFQATLFLMPGLYTTDIFSYVMYGQIAAVYGQNPYITPPAAFPDSPLLSWINPIWHQQPSVYGPLWTGIGWLVASATQRLSLVGQVFAYKLLMNGVHLANLGLVWWLLGWFVPDRGSARARLTAFALFAWNPLVLFEVAGNAHNDALMVTLLLLGLVPVVGAFRARGSAPGGAGVERGGAEANRAWLAGLVLVGSSALVKYTTALVGLFYAVAWARQLPSWPARVARIGGAGLLVLGISLALFWPWLVLPGALAPMLAAAGGDRYLNSVPDLLALTVADRLLAPAGLDPAAAQEVARSWMKVATRSLFLIYLVWEVRQLWSVAAAGRERAVRAVVAASARAFLVLIVLVLTWVLAWYFSWPLALAALLGWRSTLARVVVGYTVTSLPAFYVNQYWAGQQSGGLLLLYAGLPLLIPLVGAARGRPRLWGVVALALIAAAAALALSVGARPAPYCRLGETPRFVLGFAALEQRLGETMGDPVECEHPDPDEDGTFQKTSRGLAFYRRSTNTPTFSDGFEHWALTAGGLVYWTGEGLDPPATAAPAPR